MSESANEFDRLLEAHQDFMKWIRRDLEHSRKYSLQCWIHYLAWNERVSVRDLACLVWTASPEAARLLSNGVVASNTEAAHVRNNPEVYPEDYLRHFRTADFAEVDQ